MSHVEVVPLSSLVVEGRGISYGIVQPGAAQADGVPMIRVSDIRGGRIATDAPLRVAPAVEATHARTRLAGGELLLTLVGTVGETAIVPKELAGWNVARAVAVLPIRPDVGSHWVKLALESPLVRERIYGRLNTTVQATLNLKDVGELPILLPPRAEREAILNIVGALEEKLELNRRTADTLEALAQALFTSWIVEFDPVRAKAAGTANDIIAQQFAVPAEMLSLFPSGLDTESEDEWPTGWQRRSLDDVAYFLNGLALQRYPPNGDETLPIIKIAQLRARNADGADRASTDVPEAYVIENGDLLFSWSGSLEVDFWCGGRGALNQHLFKVSSVVAPQWYTYLWTKHHLPGFRAIAANKATTMGHIQRKHLTDAQVLLPPKPLIDAMDMMMAPIFSLLIENRLEERTLAELRDRLLTKLLAGDLNALGRK